MSRFTKCLSLSMAAALLLVLSTATASRDLRDAVAQGRLVREGGGRNARYMPTG